MIELLVTLMLLAIISGGITMAFGTSLRAFTAVRRHSEVAERWRLVTERLRTDLQGAWLHRVSPTPPPGTRSQFTWFQASSPDVSGTSATSTTAVALPQGELLSLTTARSPSSDAVRQDEEVGGASGPQSDVMEVSWWLEQSPDGTQQLVRRERTPPTPPDPTVDETQDAAVTRTVVAQGIRQMTLRFFDSSQFQWVQVWDTTDQTATTGVASTTPELPALVEVTLQFESDLPGGSLGAFRFPGGTRPATEATMPKLTLAIAMPQPLDPPPAAPTQ